MRRAHRLTSGLLAAALACIGSLSLETAASAQTAGQARGLRYLSWNNRAGPTGADTVVEASGAATRHDLRRPNTVIPHGGFATAVPAARAEAPAARSSARPSLTPANAWMRPPVEAPRLQPAPVAAPTAPPPVAVSPARTGPDYLPDQGGRSQPVPTLTIAPEPAAPMTAPVDPMAPRHDAPIFRMQRDAAVPQTTTPAPAPVASPAQDAPGQAARAVPIAGTAERPPQQGARYYSVHRQIGRRPDALAMPEPGYVDGLAVGEIETLASQDLAAPEPGPTLVRDTNGRVRAQPAASDGDHQ